MTFTSSVPAEKKRRENPSPAYSAFEAATGQPIARALAGYLANADGAEL